MAEKVTKKIPNTQSIEELAEFWDTHSLTDFEDQLEEVIEPVFERETEPLTIRLLPEEVEAVKEMAKSQGTSQTLLVRNWVLEKIQETA